MRFLIVIFILIFSLSVFSQNKKRLKDLDKILSEQSLFIAECEKQTKESQIKNSGKELPKIAGDCEWTSNGCPLKIEKPTYPNSARKNGIVEPVKVKIIIDEQGKVIYSEAVSGKKLFHRNAERAALKSLYRPIILCGKAVMQKKYIVYNFVPD